MKTRARPAPRAWLSLVLWVGFVVLASLAAAVGSFENLTFVYQGL
jgi:hypothetical protein